jgi:hypothetical protein
MKGILWNIRGLNMPGRKLSLEHIIRDHKLDFVGVQETKKEVFPINFLKNLTCPACFNWEFLPARGTAGGILFGVREDTFSISNVKIGIFSLSCMIQNKSDQFSWRIVVVYGLPYDEGKPTFIDELHEVLSQRQGPTLIGGISICAYLHLIRAMVGLI